MSRRLEIIDRPPDDESIGALFSRLAEDAERVVRAEIALFRAKLVDRVGQAAGALVFGALALLLAQSAIFGLVVGLIIILCDPVGPIWATVIVVGGVLALAGLMGWIALTKAKRVTGGETADE